MGARGDRDGWRELLLRGAHLAGLAGLAFAQPLYDFLQGDLSVVATDATGWALILLVAAIALAAPGTPRRSC